MSFHVISCHDVSSTACQIQVKQLGDEMQQLTGGMEKVERELNASEKDGPVSEEFRKVRSRNADSCIGHAACRGRYAVHGDCRAANYSETRGGSRGRIVIPPA